MTDRELLERAAKAAGIAVVWFSGLGTCLEDKPFPTRWNPLDDDGDALRLAVRLGISIGRSAAGADRWAAQHSLDTIFYEAGDPYAATRRAIVRAAAEMAP